MSRIRGIFSASFLVSVIKSCRLHVTSTINTLSASVQSNVIKAEILVLEPIKRSITIIKSSIVSNAVLVSIKSNRIVSTNFLNSITARYKDNRPLAFTSIIYVEFDYINDYVDNSYMAELYVATPIPRG